MSDPAPLDRGYRSDGLDGARQPRGLPQTRVKRAHDHPALRRFRLAPLLARSRGWLPIAQ